MNYQEDVLFVGQGAGFQSVECDTGIFKAFCERDFVPGHAMASSGSALFSSAFYSKGVEWIEQLIRSRSPLGFIELCPYQAVKTVIGASNYVVDNDKIKELLEENMTGEATKRVIVSVTRLNDWSAHLKRATPAYTLAATSIPFIFKPVRIGDALWVDGGVLNNVPIPRGDEIKKWKHIFVFIAPTYVPYKSEDGIWGMLNLLNAALDREFHQLKEDGFFELPNVHLIHPEDGFGSNLFAWSDQYKLLDYCHDKTLEILDSIDI